MVSQAPAAIDVRGVHKSYDQGGSPVRALRGVDLLVGQSEFVGVMGPSGSGKSTLLNIIAGLESPMEGDVFVAGEGLIGRDEDELAEIRSRNIGIVFQFFNLLEALTARENVELAVLAAGGKRRAAETRATEMLDLLGLSQQANESPSVLSGGGRQRLAIARALANNPPVLLADEPTGALDSDGAYEILELLRRVHGEGRSILLVTHDPTVAAAADRVVHLADGKAVPGAG